MAIVTHEATSQEQTAASLPTVRMALPLPGFESLTLFALVEVGGDDPLPDLAALTDPGALLFELVSIEQPEIRFLVAVPTAFFPNYIFEVDEPTCAALDLTRDDDALTFVILTVGEPAGATTANLLAPLVVNARTLQAAQVILSGTAWPVRAPIE